MYRLTAKPFLEAGWNVAVVGYRTHPDADADGQAEDVERARAFLASERPDVSSERVALVGHSSGSHIALLSVLEGVRRRKESGEGVGEIDDFVGIAGVYCIASHFGVEAARGVDQISPMLPACGGSVETLSHYSPEYRMDQISEECGNRGVGRSNFGDDVPRLLLVHGVKDTTAPYTASLDMVDKFRSVGWGGDDAHCEELLLHDLGHIEPVLHFMVGGETVTKVMIWLDR